MIPVLGLVLNLWNVLVSVRVAVWLMVPWMVGWLTAMMAAGLLRATSMATVFDCRIRRD